MNELIVSVMNLLTRAIEAYEKKIASECKQNDWYIERSQRREEKEDGAPCSGTCKKPDLTPEPEVKKESAPPATDGIDPYSLPEKKRYTAAERDAITAELDMQGIEWAAKAPTATLLKQLLDLNLSPVETEDDIFNDAPEETGDDDLFGDDPPKVEEKAFTQDEARRALIAHKNNEIKNGKNGDVTKAILQKFGKVLADVSPKDYAEMIKLLKV